MSLPRLLILLLAAAALSGCSVQTLQLGTSQLHGDQLWQGRVEIVGDVELAADSTLVVLPGTEVVFLPAPAELDQLRDHPHFVGSELILRGKVTAEGTAARPIRFRSSVAAAPAGSWGGVNIIESPAASFSHVLFQSADSALHIQQSTAVVEKCVFRNNLVGIRFHSSDILIENNLFENNDSGIRFHFGAPVICRNRFVANNKSLFITSFPQDYRIEYNQFLSTDNYHVTLGEEVSDDVLLRNNWWSELTDPQLEELLFDGRREAHLGQIRYRPRLRQPVTDVGPCWQR